VCCGDTVNSRVRKIIKVRGVTLQLIKIREGNEHSVTVVVSGYTNTHTKNGIITSIWGIVTLLRVCYYELMFL